VRGNKIDNKVRKKINEYEQGGKELGNVHAPAEQNQIRGDDDGHPSQAKNDLFMLYRIFYLHRFRLSGC